MPRRASPPDRGRRRTSTSSTRRGRARRDRCRGRSARRCAGAPRGLLLRGTRRSVLSSGASRGWRRRRQRRGSPGCGRRSGQRDQVVAVPDAVAVGLAEADGAAEHRPVEARRVDLDGGARSARRAEAIASRLRVSAPVRSGSISSSRPPRMPERKPGEHPPGRLPRSRSSTAAYSAEVAARREERLSPPTLVA